MSNANPLAQPPAGLAQAIADLDAGNIAVAAASAARLLDEHPGDHAVLHFAASVATAEKRYADAEQLFNRAIAAAPDAQSRGKSWNGMGHLAKAAGNLAGAEEAFRRAMLADPSSVEHVLNFGDTLAKLGKLEPAIDVLRSAIVRHPRDPQPCLTLGNIMLHATRQRDALAFYDMALQRDPNLAAAHFNAGVALTMLGKIDAARDACGIALKLDPGMPGYYQLASLDALKPDDAAIPRLEGLLQKAESPLETRIDAGFALARVYDDAGDPARAFPPLQKANALKRASLDYDIAKDVENFDRITAFFTPDFFKRFPALTDSTLAPIFILGMPRSGSTLTEQIFASHSQVQSGGELPYMIEIARQIGDIWGSRGDASPGTVEQVSADLRHARDSYGRQTSALHRRPHFTDKMPGNFMFIGLLHLMFPQGRFIHCRRDPVDTCLSCYQRLFTTYVPYSFDLTELGRYYRLYQRLMAHWHAVLPGRILDVDYESVVAEPEKNVRRMLEFCGLSFEPGCLEFQNTQRAVATASAVQVRKPLYSTSVQRWKKYGADLDPLLIALGMERHRT